VKNVLVYVVEDPRADLVPVRKLLEFHVDNSLELGWRPDDLLFLTSFPFEHRGVRAVEVDAGQRPRTARVTVYHKIRNLLEVFDRLDDGEFCWYHDTDAYQLEPFAAPPSERPLSFCLYTQRGLHAVQGGSLFFSAAARPVFAEVYDLLVHRGCRLDEYALTDVVGRPEFFGYFEALDYAYNLGTTSFALRYQLARPPIKVAHFHFGRPDHRAVFLEGGNTLGVYPLPPRFLELMARHGYLDPKELTTAVVERGRRSAEFEVSRNYGSTTWRSLRKRLPWVR
jgi:hypothetical protein